MNSKKIDPAREKKVAPTVFPFKSNDRNPVAHSSNNMQCGPTAHSSNNMQCGPTAHSSNNMQCSASHSKSKWTLTHEELERILAVS